MMNAVDAAAAAAAEAVMRGRDGVVHDVPGERHERVLLRPWLENLIHSGVIPGLEWIDAGKTMFKVPWKHRSKKNWSLRHSSVFLEWAKNTGRWREGDPEPNYAQLKTRLRCAFNKAPDIDEIKELHCTKSEEPYKVYRFTERRDGKSRPLVRMFITRSTRSLAPRRRRRPKTNARGSSLSTTSSSSVAATTSASYRVEDLKQEPLSAEINGNYGKCLMKVEPAANVIPRSFATQLSELPVTYHTSMPLAVDRYGWQDERLTSQRILPPPELDCMLSTSNWSPPFPVCPEQLSPYRRLSVRESRASSVEGYVEAAMPLELRTRAAVEENERHRRLSDYGDVPRTSHDGMNFLSPAMPGVSSVCQDPVSRSTVLPPVQSSHRATTSEEMEPSDSVAARVLSCDEDDSAPPIVRFKNRYRRALELEVQQRQCCERVRDWNHNETTKLHEVKDNYSPVDDHYCTEYVSSSSDALCLRERRSVSVETRPSEKRTWSRITPEVDCSDPWMSSSKISCRDVASASTRVDVYYLSMQRESDELPKRYQEIHRQSSEYNRNCTVEPRELKFNPDGRLDTYGASEMLFQENPSHQSAALNLSHRTEHCTSDLDEAVDLSTKTSLPTTACFITSASDERKHTGTADPSVQPYECIAAGDELQDAEFVASRHGDVDVGRIEADFQRKSELIQTKTAVLNDKERELRLLEHQLAARERALLWQECQMHVDTGSKHASALSPLESSSYWQRREDPSGQQAEKYRDQLTKEEPHAQHHYVSSVFDCNQHVRPPDCSVPTSASGWAMEKLEEQFARLVHTRATDVFSQRPDFGQTQTCVQQPSKVQQRPEAVMFYPVNHRFNTANLQNGLMHKFPNVVRKRGRPRGSRSRYTAKTPSEPELVQPQWMRNLCVHPQTLQNSAITSSAADEAVRHSVARQMTISGRLPVYAGTTAGSCQTVPEMFTGGRPSPSEQLEASCGGAEESTASVSPTRDHPLSVASTPSRVQQLLASAASTTGASILPPLSPIATAEFSASLAGDTGRAHVQQDSSQRGKSGGDVDAGRDIAYRLVDSPATASDRVISGHYGAAGSEQITFIDRTVRCAAAREKHLSDEALMAADSGAGGCGSEAVQSSRVRTNHILPKVSSFDAGHGWNSTQEESVSDHMAAGTADHGDDDDDQRLVVVIESD